MSRFGPTPHQKKLAERLGITLGENEPSRVLNARVNVALRARSEAILKENKALQVKKIIEYKGAPHRISQIRIQDNKLQMSPCGGGAMVWVLILDLENAREAELPE